MDNVSQETITENAAKVIRLQYGWADLRGATSLAQLEAYWFAIRAGRIVPSRADVDPRSIQNALRHTFIIERIAPGHARIRIAGAHVSDIMGMEVRGMPLSALFEPASRVELQASLRGLFDAPAIQKFSLQSEGRIGRPALRAQLALYPLSNDQGEINRAIGCIVTEGTMGRTPRRFDVIDARQRYLEVPSSDVAAKRRATFPEATPAKVAQAAEPAATFESTAVPWLRVVSGNG